MDYRRRQGVQMSWTSKEDGDRTAYHYDYASSSLPSSSASSIAAKAIRESSAFRDSSLSAAYGQHYSPSAPRDNNPVRSSRQDSTTHEYAPLKNLNESKQRFWGLLARKAKAILDDDNVSQSHETPATGRRYQMPREAIGGQYHTSSSFESRQKIDSPTFQKGLDAIASSLNYIGSTIGNAFEEGFTMAENRTIEIIQETRMRRKGDSELHNQPPNANTRRPPLMQNRVQPQIQTDLETQLKASRDVAMAMAAKAKVLLRELKTVKADLMFAKNRCSQLEEENRVLRESHGNGDNPDDDDLIRLQLETLLSEKARLAQENSVFARENRFLREIVEYHQLTMQDVVYLDENSEEVTEVYPIKVSTTNNLSSVASPDNPLSAPSPCISHPIY